MKYKYIFAIIIVLINTIVSGQTSDILIKPKDQRVIEAYSYLFVQDYFLNRIKKEHPQFEASTMKTELTFDMSFGVSKQKISKYLIELLGQSEFDKYKNNLMTNAQKLLSNEILTEEMALNYLSLVESKSNGNIESPILETLLSFQFSESPQNEFTSGFTYVYKTKGHIKSKNTDWQIKIPKSWKALESETPNVIQGFISDYGAGSHYITLMVKELPFSKDEKMTKNELNNLFSEKEMKDAVPVGGKFISFTRMTICLNIGGMLEYEHILELLDVKAKNRVVQFMFISGNKMYFLQCTVKSQKIDTDLSLEIKKYYPLFKLVAKSIIVNDQFN